MTMIGRLSCLALLLGANSALAQEEPARPLFYTPNDVILVLGATPQEVPVYKEAMKDARLRRIGGVEYWEGHINGKAVDLAETGVGKARASTVTSLLITVLKPRVVLMSGTAGRPNPDMRAGDVIVAAQLYEPVSAKLTAKEMAYWKVEPMRPPASLLAIAEKAIASYKPPTETVAGETYQTRVRTGIVVTSDEGRQADVAETFHADLHEMESAAFARTCDILGVPCIVVRGGSNKPALNGKDDDQSGYQGYRHLSPIAARDAALFGVHLISYL
jgi:5'-methylthioadenosine/S-adenosylhomocysteine nucleosidase